MRIDDVTVLRDTGKKILCACEEWDMDIWIPCSVVIARWFAERERLA